MPNESMGKGPGLKRSVSLFEATTYGVGVILGAGIYALIGKAAGLAGNAMWLSFVFSGLIASFTALSYAELSSMFPKESAEFLYVKKAFKREWFAFFIAWIAIVIGFISVAAVALGFGGYLSFLLQGLFPVPVLVGALGLIVAASLINFWGIKASLRANTIATLIEVGGLVIIILIAIPFLGSVDYFLTPEPAESIFSLISPITAATALIFFAFIGFEGLANITEETKQATKTIPRAVILSLAISTIIYVLVALSVVSVVSWETLAASNAPLALVAEQVFGSNVGMAMAAIALISTANTVLILLIAVSRRFYGVSQEHCLPNFLHKIHPKTRTPYYAIFAAMVLAIIFALSGDITSIAFITDFGVFAVFLVVNLAVIFLRFSDPAAKRPFRIPLNIGEFPVLPFLGIIACAYMLFSFSFEIALFSSAVFVISLPFYFLCRGWFGTKPGSLAPLKP
ncbi:MAG: amino acid permease [archaeon]|jgi:APA family basic amino acid/polyamine antiporter|nr:amino acid permease [archaeon]